MKTVGIVVSCVLGLALLIAIGVGLSYGDIALYRWLGPKREAARTEVYRESKSYVEGTVRDLRELRVAYETTDEEHKDVVRSLILHRANELDWGRLPSDLRQFLEEL